MSIWGYLVLKDKDFMPVLLGGSGDLDNCNKGFPYQSEEQTKNLKWYMQF